MSAIDHFNLRNFDLNLLLAFDALMQERSVTLAATRLHIQQPAMSHALKALRLLFGDELFIRTPQGMDPTARALELADMVRRTLQHAQDTLLSRPLFDPATETRTFRLGLSAEAELLALPGLVTRLAREAPHVRLLSRAVTRAGVADLLDDGTVDVAVGCFEDSAVRHRRQDLFEETHLCCYSQRLMPDDFALDLARYAATPHAMISLKDNLAGCLEDAMAEAGVKPNVVVAVPNFVTLAAIAAGAPILATLPARVAALFASEFGLVTAHLPFPLRSFPVSIAWHARLGNDPASAWLRGCIQDVVQG